MSPERWETHWDAGHNWALILAGGEGTRLQALTRLASGIAVPKQFCSLGHSGSLLHDAATRANLITQPERTTVVVSEHQASELASAHADPSAFLNLAGCALQMQATA